MLISNTLFNAFLENLPQSVKLILAFGNNGWQIPGDRGRLVYDFYLGAIALMMVCGDRLS